MVSLDQDLLRMVRRNKLLGMWAAEKLGLVGERADAYSNDLALGTLDFKRDLRDKIRNDFSAAGVVQSDEEILRVMDVFWVEASSLSQSKRGDASDGATVQIARNLMTR